MLEVYGNDLDGPNTATQLHKLHSNIPKEVYTISDLIYYVQYLSTDERELLK